MSMKLILDPHDLKPEFDKRSIPAKNINFHSFKEDAQRAIRLVGPCKAFYEEVRNGQKYPIIPPKEKAGQVTDEDKVAALSTIANKFAEWVGTHPLDMGILVMLPLFRIAVERVNVAKTKAELQQALEAFK